MTQIESLWQEFRLDAVGSRITEGEFRLVRMDSPHPFEIYAGVDGSGSIMLAVGVTSRPPVIDADTGALNYIRLQRASGTWIMALRLTCASLEAVFGRLCQDLIDAAAKVTTEAALVSLFKERLLLWKQLFLDGGAGLLQKFQIKGLIAELLALEAFLQSDIDDPALPVMSWIGPAGADQDFLFADRAVEIKSVSPGAEKVSISSAGQLYASVPLELQLYVLRESSPSESGGVNLPALTSRIEKRLSDQPNVLHVFRSKLIEAGYVDVEREYYESVAFTLMEVRCYAVREGFPRLVRQELPNAIVDIVYSIQLSLIAPFQIFERPNET